MRDPCLVAPGARVRLADFDPADTREARTEEDSLPKIGADLATLRELQALLYAAAHQSVLIVLQGIDTAGKDGTIRHVFTSVNPQGCRVASFKKPTEEELAHDFLWRVHKRAPARGEIAVFNRSHYEGVLVERVHGLVPARTWKGRYDEINEFERLLVRDHTIVLKFFLNLSKKEQKRRLLARIEDPDKRWKANPDDWEERKLWDDYQEAFSDMLTRTSTREAPWYVVPSDAKWYRNMIVADRITDRLRPLEKEWRRVVRTRGAAVLAAAQRMRKR
jgi:PPK2 family polyphosphate:nucleotide phosphotransferase